jgi:hypothetical protein
LIGRAIYESDNHVYFILGKHILYILFSESFVICIQYLFCLKLANRLYVRIARKRFKDNKGEADKKKSLVSCMSMGDDDDFWCSTPLSTIFQLYYGDQF